MRALRRWWDSVPAELLVLTALSFLTRGWHLFTPRGKVFDEIHFERYAAAYFSGRYYVDVHPPLGKLLYALTAWLLRVPEAQLASGVSIPHLRVLPALLGALVIPTFWLMLRRLGATRKVAAFGAALLLLDNALLDESRFVFMDIVLVWAGLAAVTAFLVARARQGRARWGWLASAAVLAGASVSIKWTGLSALGLIGGAWLVDAWRARAHAPLRRLAGEATLLAMIPGTVYIASFAVHFALLPNAGAGVELMSPAFAATRQEWPGYRGDAPESFVAEFVELNRLMTSVNLGWSNTTQPAASPWYTWPISKHRIRLWQSPGDTTVSAARIELQGNPVLWYGILVTSALFVVALALRRVTVGAHRDAFWFLAAGYALNFVPFAFITRPMYLYHYFFALLYSVAFAVLALGIMAGWQDDDGPPWRFPSARSRALYAAVLALVAVSFAYFAPLSYGTTLSAEALARRQWVLERH